MVESGESFARLRVSSDAAALPLAPRDRAVDRQRRRITAMNAGSRLPLEILLREDRRHLARMRVDASSMNMTCSPFDRKTKATPSASA